MSLFIYLFGCVFLPSMSWRTSFSFVQTSLVQIWRIYLDLVHPWKNGVKYKSSRSQQKRPPSLCRTSHNLMKLLAQPLQVCHRSNLHRRKIALGLQSLRGTARIDLRWHIRVSRSQVLWVPSLLRTYQNLMNMTTWTLKACRTSSMRCFKIVWCLQNHWKTASMDLCWGSRSCAWQLPSHCGNYQNMMNMTKRTLKACRTSYLRRWKVLWGIQGLRGTARMDLCCVRRGSRSRTQQASSHRYTSQNLMKTSAQTLQVWCTSSLIILKRAPGLQGRRGTSNMDLRRFIRGIHSTLQWAPFRCRTSENQMGMTKIALQYCRTSYLSCSKQILGIQGLQGTAYMDLRWIWRGSRRRSWHPKGVCQVWRICGTLW